MLLMKDRSFFYELRAYLICVKVGEKKFHDCLFASLDEEALPILEVTIHYVAFSVFINCKLFLVLLFLFLDKSIIYRRGI